MGRTRDRCADRWLHNLGWVLNLQQCNQQAEFAGSTEWDLWLIFNNALLMSASSCYVCSVLFMQPPG